MSELTNAEFEIVEATRTETINGETVTQDWGHKADLNRWREGGHDRVYINEISSSSDVYINVDSGEVETDLSRLEHDVERDGNEWTISVSHSKDYTVVVRALVNNDEDSKQEAVADGGEGDDEAAEEEEETADGGSADDPERATDGGEVVADRVTDYVDDAIIEDALAQHDDPEHPDALTVDDVRELLAHVQHDAEAVWNQWVDNIERTDTLVVAQDDNVVVLDTGEHDTTQRALETYDGPVRVDDIAERVVSSVHHRVAEQIDREYSWGVTYPLVVRLPADGEAGQRFVEAAVNGLQRRGLAPGQAWAYYGVNIRGESRNSWGARKGDADHKNVSDALDKATQKLPEA